MAQRRRPQGCCPLVRVRPLSSANRDRLTSMLKALSDPTRLEILRTIAAQPGPVCACDVVDRFDLSQPTISHHLKVLRDSGLVVGTSDGLEALATAVRATPRFPCCAFEGDRAGFALDVLSIGLLVVVLWVWVMPLLGVDPSAAPDWLPK